LEITYNKRL